MKRWKRLVSTVPIAGLMILWGGTACGPVHAEKLRVGLAHREEVEIRCDGPIGLTADRRTGSGIELSPGTYTIRVVETPDFYRLEPVVAGLVSSPFSPVTAVAAVPDSIHSWVVDLLKTTSKRTADRAERDARRRLGGKIATVQLDDGWLITAGPFPNEYLARQALQKAQRIGFPARIRRVAADEVWDYAGLEGAPRRIRRLVPQGEAGLTRVPERLRSKEPPVSAPEQEPLEELEPLSPLPEEALELEPLPTLPPEELLVEPFPEPEPEVLGPDLGWVPAPKPESTPPPKVRKIHPPLPKPKNLGQAPSRRYRQAVPSRPHQFRQPHSRSRPRPIRKSPPAERIPPPVPTPVPPPEPTQRTPDLKPMPSPTRSVEKATPPQPLPSPPVAAEKPAPKKKPYVFLPRKKKSKIPRSLRSFPIIRRFWWEPPLVEPSPEQIEEQLAEALRRPAPETFEQPSGTETGGIPEPVPITEPQPQVELPEIPPTPIPFDPSKARERPVVSEVPRPDVPVSTEVEGSPPAAQVAPFPEPEAAELPPESAPSFEDDELEALLPPGPEATEREEPPLLVEQEPERARSEEDVSEKTAPVSPSTPVKRITAPRVGPVRVAYIQVFDDSGDPVTDPVTVVDLKPLTGSRLEFDGHSFHGTFQLYAPNESWLVLVNEVDIENYLAGVVPKEIPTDAPLPVLKAQAVMSRCYVMLMAQRGDYADYGYDIPGDPSSEWPYFGRDLETEQTRRAVRETAGQVLIDPSSGGIATPVYCFSSGGYVADARSVWGGQGQPVPDYLEAHPDFDPATIDFEIGPDGFAEDEKLLERWLKTSPNTYDKAAAGEHFRWKKRLSGREMDELVNSYWNDQVGHVKSIVIEKRAVSGHATRMVIRGEKQTVTARDSDTIRAALNLDSSLIIIKERFGSGWEIFGGGFGHGVGLSQCGAIGLVEQKNANYKQILHFYFGRLVLGKRMLVRTSRGA